MTRLLAWIGIVLIAAYVVFFAGGSPGTVHADLRIVAVGAAAVLLTGWAVVALRAASWRPRSVLMPVIAVGIASLAISTVFSRYPRISAEYLAFGIVLAALYLLLVRLLANQFFGPRLQVLASAMFFVISLGYIGTVVARWISWWAAVGSFTVPPLRPDFESLSFGNPSHLLMMTALLAVPATAAVPWTTRRGVARLIVVLALVATVALLSGSRAGWLALSIAGAAGAMLLVLLFGRRALAAARTSSGLRSTRARLVAIVGVLVASVPVLVLAPAILRRVTVGGEDLRAGYVAVALRLFGESPLTGTGLGSWVVQRIAYTVPPEIDYYIPHAHNVYVQTLAEQGIVGAAAGIIAVVALAWLIRDGIRSGGMRRQWAIAGFVSLVYFAAHEVLDFMVNLPAVLVALAVPIAYLDATSSARLPVLGRIRPSTALAKVLTAAFVAATAVSLGGLLWQELPALQNDRAVRHANVGDWESATEPARAAAGADPGISSLTFTAGLAEAHAGNHAAAAALFREVARDTDLPEAWLNLAAEDEAAGNRSAVGASLAAALRLGYQRPSIAVPAGDLALRIGDEATARDAFTAAAVVSPSLLADPWWAEDPARSAVLPGVIDAAMEAAPGQRWEIALMSGDGETAASLAPDESTTLFVAAWNGDQAARQQLIVGCRAEPLNITRLLFCARIEGHAGNSTGANEFRYIAEVQVGGGFSGWAELRVAQEQLVGHALPGSPADVWGTYTFRRATPWDILVPSLVHLTVE